MDRAEAIFILNEEIKARTDSYTTHLASGGKPDPAEEVHLDALKMALAALREQEQSKWISVKERLPELEKEVLICDLNDERDEGLYMDVWSLEDDEDGGVVWADKNGAWYSLDDVTHWMPLPEPPKEDATAQMVYEQVQGVVDQHNREAMRKIVAFIEPTKEGADNG